ncbi:hypothetical protein CAEBREN_25130 [Caenorhabditis brenneri]|uniref:Uncharacterized protein n=1 Tax=Caenorhabditis brenneri TaxID=135651 RepID=G0NXL9_CAEBE|nr:hypothetical protein CAEBREN_25130 [Caenorhabditis brenneri]
MLREHVDLLKRADGNSREYCCDDRSWKHQLTGPIGVSGVR